MEATGPRALALGALKHAWGWDVRKIEEVLKDEHAPPALQGRGAAVGVFLMLMAAARHPGSPTAVPIHP